MGNREILLNQSAVVTPTTWKQDTFGLGVIMTANEGDDVLKEQTRHFESFRF